MKRLPATTGHEVSNHIAKTREFWRPRYGRDLSDEEVSNISRTLTVLIFACSPDWSRAERLAARAIRCEAPRLRRRRRAMATDFALVSRARSTNSSARRDNAPHLQAVLSAVRDHRLAWLTPAPKLRVHQRGARYSPRGRALVLLGDDTDRALGPAGFHAASTRRLFHKADYVAVMSGAPVAEVYAARASTRSRSAASSSSSRPGSSRRSPG